jgi:hypothetical protein
MKVKIKDLEPNPYRDMENYPIDETKIQTLIGSYNQTGFWRNINARPKPGIKDKYQLAYGHHRLIALKKLYGEDHIIDIVVEKYSDATMLKMMASENNTDFRTNVAVTLETVKVTRQFLKDHPEEIKTSAPISWRVSTEGYRRTAEAFQIAEFLDWSEHKVYDALSQLDSIKAGDIDEKVIINMPSFKAATRFTDAVKKHSFKKDLDKQRSVVEQLEREDSFSESAVEKAFLEEKWKPLPAAEKKKEKNLSTLDDAITEIGLYANSLDVRLRTVNSLMIELGSDLVINKLNSAMTTVSLKRLYESLTNLLNNIKNEN